MFVTRQVIVETLFRWDPLAFQLDDHPRQTIDEKRDVGDAFVEGASVCKINWSKFTVIARNS